MTTATLMGGMEDEAVVTDCERGRGGRGGGEEGGGGSSHRLQHYDAMHDGERMALLASKHTEEAGDQRNHKSAAKNRSGYGSPGWISSLSSSPTKALLVVTLLVSFVVAVSFGYGRQQEAEGQVSTKAQVQSLSSLTIPLAAKSKHNDDDDDDDDDDDEKGDTSNGCDTTTQQDRISNGETYDSFLSHTKNPNRTIQAIESLVKTHDNEDGFNTSGLVRNRCDWVVKLFTKKYQGRSEKELATQYAVQAEDPNVFYRATADIFWQDFAKHGWGEKLQFENIGILNPSLADGSPLQPRSSWTWITGDQHLSNFGAWRNRNGKIVFSVNDFDEAAIYDFQVDVFRIAVSVCSHAYTNGFAIDFIDLVLQAFTDSYVETLINYVGSDKELLFELTPKTATGILKVYLEYVKQNENSEKQLAKFTHKNKHGNRRFLKNDDTRLVAVDDELADQIRQQFTLDNYGATMMKTGWHVRYWDDDYFRITDIAARVGSGVGSYGVDRYYVLLHGTDGLLGDDGADGNAVILDVKYEPPGAVSNVLTRADEAWYNVWFAHAAQRAVEAQRRLTSYTDPYTGWITLDGRAFVVRQRSPWKDSPNLNLLTDPDDFIDFMEQVGKATATSHARGTSAKSPGQFKHVIAGVLGNWLDRRTWGQAVARLAHEYRNQVLLDFQCFRAYVKENYPGAIKEPTSKGNTGSSSSKNDDDS